MADARTAELLSLAHDLERRDIEVAARIETVASLLRQVDAVRAGATETRLALEGMPELVGLAEAANSASRARKTTAERDLREASRAHAEAKRSRRSGEEGNAAAERALRRATVADTDAAAAVARTFERLEKLAADEIAVRASAEGCAVEARAIASAVAEVPRLSDSGRTMPGTTLAGIEEWGARTHAALFVVRGSLENERERLVIEANGLAAAVLGEHVGGVSVALVRRRLDDLLADV